MSRLNLFRRSVVDKVGAKAALAKKSVRGGRAGSLAGALSGAINDLEKFQVQSYELPILEPGTLGRKDAFTILHISDIHMVPGQRVKSAFLQDLDMLKPDYVVNTGDNLSDLDAVPEVLQALDQLLHIPGVFVFGSNDYYAPRPVNPLVYFAGRKHKSSDVELPWRDMRAAFLERGWHDATHQRVEIKVEGVKLAIAGVDDPHHGLDDYSTIAGPPNPDADLRIGLTHAPEPRILRSFADDGYDLVLAGHTHGGQVCLPGGRALVTNCGIEQSKAKGMFLWDDEMLVNVTPGLGTSKYAQVRLFCPPAATLIRITEREDNDEN